MYRADRRGVVLQYSWLGACTAYTALQRTGCTSPHTVTSNASCRRKSAVAERCAIGLAALNMNRAPLRRST